MTHGHHWGNKLATSLDSTRMTAVSISPSKRLLPINTVIVTDPPEQHKLQVNLNASVFATPISVLQFSEVSTKFNICVTHL